MITVARRPLLSHQVAPSPSHGDRKERSSRIRARRPCQLPRPLHDAAGGHPMVHARTRRRLSRTGEENWRAQAVWSEQAGNIYFAPDICPLLIHRVIGQHPHLELARSEIRRRRHRVHLPTPRKRSFGSRA